MNLPKARRDNLQRRSEALNFAELRLAVYKRIKMVATFPLVLALCATALVLLLPDRYDATFTIELAPPRKPANLSTIEDFETAEQRAIGAEIEAVRSEAVIGRVVADLKLMDDPEFRRGSLTAVFRKLLRREDSGVDVITDINNRLSVARVRSTLLINVRFSSRDPEKSARIANAIATTYLAAKEPALSIPAVIQAGKGTPSERVFASLLAAYGQKSPISSARLVAAAEAPRAPAAPKRKQAVLVTFLASLIGSMGLALLLELRASAKVRSRIVEQKLACPHMSSLPELAQPGAGPAATRAVRLVLAEPNGVYAEAIRNASNELARRRNGDGPRLILVVSALPGEGAELFASNLAHHLALTGDSVLLVDANLRMKVLTRQLANCVSTGLIDQIASHRPVEEAILRDGVTGLHFLPAAGPAPIPFSAPSALHSAAFTGALTALKECFFTVILSAPPLLPVTDARILAEFADQIVFVTAWEKTPRSLARKALETLGVNQSKVTGAVLTDVSEDAGTTLMSFADIFDEIRRTAALAIVSLRAA
jgi:Mrp family chromosome partitioning ATPase/capsular polysaccharide biosynthesis protein